MNRKLLLSAGAVALVIAGYAGSSWQAGARIQSEADTATEAVNNYLTKQWPDQVLLTQTSYNRGVFSSQATYTLSFPTSNEAGAKPEIVFVNQIKHGPLPVSELFKGHFSLIGAVIETSMARTPFTEDLFKALNGQSLLQGTAIVDRKGQAHIHWVARALDITQKGVRSNFTGAELKAEVGPSLSFTRGALVLKGLTLSDEQNSFDIQNSRIHADTTQGSFGLNLGTSGAEIGSLSLTVPNTIDLKAENILSRFSLKENGALIEGSAQYEVGALALNKKDWGKITFAADYGKLDGKGLKSLLDLNSSLVSRSMNNPQEADLINASDVKQFWQSLHILSQAAPTLQISPLAWQTKDGTSQFELKAAFAPTNIKPNGIGLSSNPLDTLEGKLTLSRPMIAGLLMQNMQSKGMTAAQSKSRTDAEIKTMLDAVSQFKIGKFEGDTLTVKLSFEKNKFQINGQPMSIDKLFQFLASAVPSAWLEEESTKQDKPDETSEIKHLDPSVLASILTTSDYAFEEGKDDEGDPILKIRPGSTGAEKIEFIFIGCASDPTCEDVLLRATYSPDRAVALKVVNNWNLRNRWARAYVNDKREAVIEMDISAYGGIGREAVEGMVNMFFKIVGDFSKDLNQTK